MSGHKLVVNRLAFEFREDPMQLEQIANLPTPEVVWQAQRRDHFLDRF
jgi:hypothetical protein